MSLRRRGEGDSSSSNVAGYLAANDEDGTPISQTRGTRSRPATGFDFTDVSKGVNAKSLPAAPVSAFAAAAGADADVKQEDQDWILKYEAYMPWIVFCVAVATRYYRIAKPPGVVFDEIHFGHFTNWYTQHLYYFDIHPPLGKLTFWFVGWLFGYDHAPCEFEEINKDYAPECQFYLLRYTSAFFSVWSCVLMYLCTRNFGASVYGGLIAASLLIFDNINLTEGRLILMDSQLLFWCIAALWVAQCWWKRLNEHYAAEAALQHAAGAPRTGAHSTRACTGSWSDFCSSWRTLDGVAHDGVPTRTMSALVSNAWCVVVGFTCACAFSIKMTGAATPAMVAVESFFGLWFLRRATKFVDLLKILFVGAMTYAFWFWCHFSLMWYSGPNRVEEEFMTPLFQSTLINANKYDPTGASLSEWRSKEGFWWTMITHNIRMVVHNAAILEPHHWQAAWWEWLLDLRGVAYYGKDVRPGYHAQVYLIGNPAVLWSVLVWLAVAAAFCFVYVRYRSQLSALNVQHSMFRQLTFCLAVYCLNLMPYLGVKRSTFIYHYMPALAYAQIVSGRIIDGLVPRKYIAVATKLYLLFILVGWLYMAPWVYALPLTPDGHERRRIMPRWN